MISIDLNKSELENINILLEDAGYPSEKSSEFSPHSVSLDTDINDGVSSKLNVQLTGSLIDIIEQDATDDVPAEEGKKFVQHTYKRAKPGDYIFHVASGKYSIKDTQLFMLTNDNFFLKGLVNNILKGNEGLVSNKSTTILDKVQVNDEGGIKHGNVNVNFVVAEDSLCWVSQDNAEVYVEFDLNDKAKYPTSTRDSFFESIITSNDSRIGLTVFSLIDNQTIVDAAQIYPFDPVINDDGEFYKITPSEHEDIPTNAEDNILSLNIGRWYTTEYFGNVTPSALIDKAIKVQYENKEQDSMHPDQVVNPEHRRLNMVESLVEKIKEKNLGTLDSVIEVKEIELYDELKSVIEYNGNESLYSLLDIAEDYQLTVESAIYNTEYSGFKKYNLLSLELGNEEVGLKDTRNNKIVTLVPKAPLWFVLDRFRVEGNRDSNPLERVKTLIPNATEIKAIDENTGDVFITSSNEAKLLDKDNAILCIKTTDDLTDFTTASGKLLEVANDMLQNGYLYSGTIPERDLSSLFSVEIEEESNRVTLGYSRDTEHSVVAKIIYNGADRKFWDVEKPLLLMLQWGDTPVTTISPSESLNGFNSNP